MSTSWRQSLSETQNKLQRAEEKLKKYSPEIDIKVIKINQKLMLHQLDKLNGIEAIVEPHEKGTYEELMSRDLVVGRPLKDTYLHLNITDKGRQYL